MSNEIYSIIMCISEIFFGLGCACNEWKYSRWIILAASMIAIISTNAKICGSF